MTIKKKQTNAKTLEERLKDIDKKLDYLIEQRQDAFRFPRTIDDRLFDYGL